MAPFLLLILSLTFSSMGSIMGQNIVLPTLPEDTVAALKNNPIDHIEEKFHALLRKSHTRDPLMAEKKAIAINDFEDLKNHNNTLKQILDVLTVRLDVILSKRFIWANKKERQVVTLLTSARRKMSKIAPSKTPIIRRFTNTLYALSMLRVKRIPWKKMLLGAGIAGLGAFGAYHLHKKTKQAIHEIHTGLKDAHEVVQLAREIQDGKGEIGGALKTTNQLAQDLQLGKGEIGQVLTHVNRLLKESHDIEQERQQKYREQHGSLAGYEREQSVLDIVRDAHTGKGELGLSLHHLNRIIKTSEEHANSPEGQKAINALKELIASKKISETLDAVQSTLADADLKRSLVDALDSISQFAGDPELHGSVTSLLKKGHEALDQGAVGNIVTTLESARQIIDAIKVRGIGIRGFSALTQGEEVVSQVSHVISRSVTEIEAYAARASSCITKIKQTLNRIEVTHDSVAIENRKAEIKLLIKQIQESSAGYFSKKEIIDAQERFLNNKRNLGSKGDKMRVAIQNQITLQKKTIDKSKAIIAAAKTQATKIDVDTIEKAIEETKAILEKASQMILKIETTL